MKDTDIVIQGGLWLETIPLAERYLKLDFVKNVFISTWTN